MSDNRRTYVPGHPSWRPPGPRLSWIALTSLQIGTIGSEHTWQTRNSVSRADSLPVVVAAAPHACRPTPLPWTSRLPFAPAAHGTQRFEAACSLTLLQPPSQTTLLPMNPHDQHPRLTPQYTLKDVARLAQASEKAVARDVKRGFLERVPYNQRRIRYTQAAVEAYLAGHHRNASQRRIPSSPRIPPITPPESILAPDDGLRSKTSRHDQDCRLGPVGVPAPATRTDPASHSLRASYPSRETSTASDGRNSAPRPEEELLSIDGPPFLIAIPTLTHLAPHVIDPEHHTLAGHHFLNVAFNTLKRNVPATLHASLGGNGGFALGAPSGLFGLAICLPCHIVLPLLPQPRASAVVSVRLVTSAAWVTHCVPEECTPLLGFSAAAQCVPHMRGDAKQRTPAALARNNRNYCHTSWLKHLATYFKPATILHAVHNN